MAETKYPTAAVRVSVPVHGRLAAIAKQLSDTRGRPVTLGEVVEIMTDAWDAAHPSGSELVYYGRPQRHACATAGGEMASGR